jgi:predicted nucleic acid-binding protein
VEFADTNIFVYAASRHQADLAKMQAAQHLIATRPLAISLQVLQEFYVVARSPRKLNLSHQEALRRCLAWRRLPILEPTVALDDAAQISDRLGIGYYDAAIVAAARKLGCAKIYSEDLNAGQDYGGVLVENPFVGL